MKLLKIKPFQETLNSGYCGPAVLKMVLQYYGINKSEKELAKLARTTKIGGTSDETIINVVRKFELKPIVKNNASLKDVERYTKRGVPVIVNWFTRGRRDYPNSAVADGHYSIVVGLDRQYIYLQDPEIGKLRKLKQDDFLRVWFDYTGEYLESRNQMIIRQFIAVQK